MAGTASLLNCILIVCNRALKGSQGSISKNLEKEVK